MSASQSRILIVDDDPANQKALQAVLANTGAHLVTAGSGEEALRQVLDQDFAAILMDVRMPGIDGFTTASMIRERKRSRYTPIIFLTADHEDVTNMFRSYRAGAVDFIPKPVIPEVLRSKIAIFVGINDMTRMLNAELAERAATESRLRASEEQLRALAMRLESIREEERIRIAREVHDDLGQALTGLKFDLASFAKHFAEDSPAVRQEKQNGLGTAIDRIINSVRRISSGLRPEVLDEIGLSAAIEWQAREFQRRTGIRCTVEISPSISDPDKERSTALFRIYQELLTNVARHANATRVNAKLVDEDVALALTVEDNGRGITNKELESPRSLGFLGLRERVLAFSGTIDVSGEEGRGTRVSVTIPTTANQPAHA
ncbi:MAG TPA: response regulator [Usitatibacter sp.]|nr:response regulator [Usitatibacter sp.]